MITVNMLQVSNNHYNTSFKANISRVQAKTLSQGKNILMASLVALGASLGLQSCDTNEPDYRHAVYDPCCPTTDTQFKDNKNHNYTNFNLMLHNLGLIDTTKIKWEDIDAIKISSVNGTKYTLENRGFPLKKMTKDNLNIAFYKESPNGKKDSIIANLNNGYGSIACDIRETSFDNLSNIPNGYTQIWQGKKQHVNGNNRFALVDGSSEELWDNLYVWERNGQKISVKDQFNSQNNLLLDTKEIVTK